MYDNLIISELEASKRYLFTMDGECLKLSQENVALAEAMIINDSDYSKSSNVNAGPDGKKYKGSTAYWMTRLKDDLLSGSRNIDKTIKEAVLAVDRENSTHITSDGIGDEILTQRILKRKETLFEELKNRNLGFKLIEDLSDRTFKGVEISENGKKYYPRENYSFATKFCHYACFYFFQGTKEQDNYSIYDGIVANALPLYLEKANIYKTKNIQYKKSDYEKAKNYKLYSELIDRLRDNKISRNGFDHLLWYYHKAR